MSVFLLLAVLVLVVIGLLVRSRTSHGQPGSSAEPDGGSSGMVHAISPAIAIPTMLGGPAGVASAHNGYASGDETWHAIHHPLDDLGNGLVGTRWPDRSMALGDLDHQLGVGPIAIDDFESHHTYINPATGLPMMSDSMVGVDVGGNPYGFNNDDPLGHNDSFGIGLGSGSHGFDDGFSSFDSGSDWP